MSGSGALLVAIVVVVTGAVGASPTDLWQRFQQRERARQTSGPLEVGPYTGLMLDQYYPLWSQAAVLQLDEPTARLTDVDDRLAEDDYGYELTPEITYGDEGDNVATGVEEQIYKDLLLRYLLREMDKQEALPVVRRRSEYKVRTAPRLSVPKAAAPVAPDTTTAAITTTMKPAVVQSQKGQKEVALLRPPSDNRHRPLSWPKELETTQTDKQEQNQKRMLETAALPTAPKKHPKEAFDMLTAQLNSLRSRAQ